MRNLVLVVILALQMSVSSQNKDTLAFTINFSPPPTLGISNCSPGYADTLSINEFQDSIDLLINGVITRVLISDFFDSDMGSVKTDNKYNNFIIGAAIRNDSIDPVTGEYRFRPIIDNGHNPVGLFKTGVVKSKSIETLSDRIRVWHEECAPNRTISSVVGQDETYSNRGLRLGHSYAPNFTDILMYFDGSSKFGVSADSTSSHSNSRDFIKRTEMLSDRMLIIHNTVGNNAIIQLTPDESSISGRGQYDYTVQQVSDTSTWVFFRLRSVVSSGKVYWDNASSSFKCFCTNASIGAYSGGFLTVDLDYEINPYGFSVTPENGLDSRAIYYNTKQFRVRWGYNDSGTFTTETTGNSEMRAIFMAPANIVKTVVPNKDLSFHISWEGTQVINPQKMDYYIGSNIWFFGINGKTF